MAHSSHFTHKLEESDDDFNSNQFSSDAAVLSVPILYLLKVSLLISYANHYCFTGTNETNYLWS